MREINKCHGVTEWLQTAIQLHEKPHVFSTIKLYDVESKNLYYSDSFKSSSIVNFKIKMHISTILTDLIRLQTT